MNTAKIQDVYGTTIEIQESCSGYFRLDLTGESFPQAKHDVTGEDIPTCLSLKENEARILQACLNSYFEEG
jgi:hypothetical protein